MTAFILKKWIHVWMIGASIFGGMNSSMSQVTCSKEKIVISIKKRLEAFYLYEPIARSMIDTLDSKFNENKYDSALNIDEFLYEITKDLRRVSNDRHILFNSGGFEKVGYLLKDIKGDKSDLTKKQLKQLFEEAKRIEKERIEKESQDEFIYGDISILPGNIGYLEIMNFYTAFRSNTSQKKMSINTVFKLLKNCNSIIIDLRRNSGGSLYMSARLCSYFARPDSYFITRKIQVKHEAFASDNKRILVENVNGELTEGKKIYVLISKETFSAGELAAYKLKSFVPSAVLVGEPTAGAFNGTLDYHLDTCFSAIISSFYLLDEEREGRKLEGRSVQPDLLTVADSALLVTYKLITGKSVLEEKKTKYFQRSKSSQFSYNYAAIKNLNEYTGEFRKAKIFVLNKRLKLEYDGLINDFLSPTTTDEFQSERFSNIKFVRNEEGKIYEIRLKGRLGLFDERFRKL